MKLEKQLAFLRNIEARRTWNVTYVNELAELLNISSDSAYWRLRWETSLTFDEISILCNHYNISFDAFNTTEETSVVSFKYQKMVGYDRKFKSHFEDLCGSIVRVSNSSEEDKRVVYAGQGLPMFYYFGSTLNLVDTG